MRTNYVPRASERVLAKPITLRAGDTPWSIAHAFGQGYAGYADLVSANLHLPLLEDVMPRGHAATLAGLQEGQQLWLPASWGPAIHRAGGNATLRAADDPVWAAALLQLVDQTAYYKQIGAQQPWNTLWNGAIIGAAANWFRQSNGNTKPDKSMLVQQVMAAIKWANTYGGSIPAKHADRLPWNEVPWASVPWNQVPWGLIDWVQVKTWLAANMPLGAVQNPLSKVPWTTIDWAAEGWAKIPWANVPWADVPWSLIPWSSIDWPKVQSAFLSKTVVLIDQLKAYVAKLPQGDVDPNPPPAECSPPRLWINGHCTCPGAGLLWNPTTQKCENKSGCAPGFQKDAKGQCVLIVDPQKPCPEGAGFHRDAQGNCVPNTTDQAAPKKEGIPWVTVLVIGLGAAAAAVATGAVESVMKGNSTPAKKSKGKSR